MKKILGRCCRILLFLITSNSGVLADGGYEIENFHVVMELYEDGSMQVEETIEVNFSEPRRGIIRKIPIRNEKNLTCNTFRTV